MAEQVGVDGFANQAEITTLRPRALDRMREFAMPTPSAALRTKSDLLGCWSRLPTPFLKLLSDLSPKPHISLSLNSPQRWLLSFDPWIASLSIEAGLFKN
jgi:hypothetical protein